MKKDKLTDIHSHIIYDIDDGSSSIEESLELLKKLSSIGFSDVILTPHYIHDSEYSALNKEKKEKFNKLQAKIKKNKIDINIYLGNEIFLHEDISSFLENEKIYSLNNTKYLLIEIPLYNRINHLEDIFHELKCLGYQVILAHPERYKSFQEDYSIMTSLKENGILFQANYGSILGYYGKKEKKLLKYMLKNDMIDYFGTDIHKVSHSFVIDNYEKIVKNIIKIIGEEKYQKIIKNGNELVKKCKNDVK